MTDASEIVDRLGGEEFLAERFGVTRKAIEMWKRRNGIPGSRHIPLLLMARERRVKLTMEELCEPSPRAAG